MPLKLWHAKNMHQKLVPDSFLILVNNPKQPLHVRNLLTYFKRKLSKSLKKFTLFFLSNQVCFSGQGYEKQKRDLELVTSCSAGCKTNLKNSFIISDVLLDQVQ